MISITRITIALSIFIVLLVGCTDVAIIVPYEDYEELPMKEETSEVASEEKNVPDNPFQNFQASTGRDAVTLLLRGICWPETVDEECNLEPTNPRESVLTDQRLMVDKGEEILIGFNQTLENYNPDHHPHRYELIQYRFHDEEGTILFSVEPTDRHISYKAPKEEGTYFYLLHVIWNESETKRVYYGFSLYVK